MDGWPKVNKQGSPTSVRPLGKNLPPSGSVVMASVEEDLGEGMYALRWAGNRVAVASQVRLKTGQSLILKSETSPEGKPTLVVQGPALPEPGKITGRVVYGPGKPRQQPIADQPPPQSQANTRDSAQTFTGQPAGTPVAAGVAKAVGVPPPPLAKEVQSLIGAILEPMPELESSVRMIEEEVQKEKNRVKEIEQKKIEQQITGRAEDGEPVTDSPVPGRQTRPAHPGMAARPGAAGLGNPVIIGQGGAGGGGVVVPPPPAPAAPTQPPSGTTEQQQQVPQQTATQPASPSPAPVPQPAGSQATEPSVPVQPPSAGPQLPQVPDGAAAPQPVPPAANPPSPSPTVQPPTPPALDLPSSAGPTVPQPSPHEPVIPPASVETPAPSGTVQPPSAGSPVPPDGPSTPVAQPLPHVLVTPPANGETPVPSVQTPPAPPSTATSQPSPQVPVTPPASGQMAAPSVPIQPSSTGPQVPQEVPSEQTPPPVPSVQTPPAPPSSATSQPSPQVPVTPPASSQTAAPSLPVQPSPTGPQIPQDAPSEQTPPPAQAGHSQPATPSVTTTAQESSGHSSTPSVSVQPLPAVPQSPQNVPHVAPLPSTPTGQAQQQPPPSTPVAPPASSPSPALTVPNTPSPAGPQTPPDAPAPQPPPSASAEQAPPPAHTAQPPTSAPATPQSSGQASTPQPPVQPPSAGPQVPVDVPPVPTEQGQTVSPSQQQPPAETPAPPRWTPQAGIPAPAAPPREQTPSPTYGPQTVPQQTPVRAPDIKPEIYLKEALTQLVKASELPLGTPGENAGVTLQNKVPDAVVDKAAAIFLRAAGLSPDEETLDIARALVKLNIPIDRDTVQVMLSAAADAPEARRQSVIDAAARLVAKDIPVSPPLVSGMADVIDRRAGAHALLRETAQALDAPELPDAARPLAQNARELLDLLHVDLGKASAADSLERYLSTFGRETMAKALSLVELSTQTVLETNPALQKIDAAMTAILKQLESELTDHAQRHDAAAGHTPDSAYAPAPTTTDKPAGTITPGPSLTPDGQIFPGAQAKPAPSSPEQPAPTPPTRPLRSPVNAYLNAPKAAPVEELLKNLPPMPKLVRIGDAIPQQPPPVEPGTRPAVTTGSTTPPTPAPQPQQPTGQGGMERPRTPVFMPGEKQMLEGGESSVLRRLDSLFQTPGLNGPGIDLLRPSGFMERFFSGTAQQSQGEQSAERIKTEAETLFRQLTSENRESVEKALKELGRKDPEVLRETAARLSRQENDIMRNDAALGKLADAASNLRDLGRQMLAVKAENVAGQDRNPGVMLAEVPLKFNDDTGDGRMQMFYRRGKDKGDGWSSRVILDLNTTRMGPVLGDMRFFNTDMILNVFVTDQHTADYLSAESEDLLDSLWAKGFRVKARFMVLPPASVPEIHAERPESLGGGRDADGHLDIKG